MTLDRDKTYVYGIREVNGPIRYIGMGVGDRMYRHLKGIRKGWRGKDRLEKFQFFVDALARGVVFEEFKIAENLTPREAAKLEINLIRSYGRLAYGTGPLINAASGGGGGSPRSADSRAKISASIKRLMADPEFKTKVLKKGIHSPEGKYRSAEAVKSPQVRLKIKESLKRIGFDHSAGRKKYFSDPANRKLYSEKVTLLWKNPEYRSKILESKKKNFAKRSAFSREAAINLWQDPEHRQKVSETWKRKREMKNARQKAGSSSTG